jgi:hypothetical protein
MFTYFELEEVGVILNQAFGVAVTTGLSCTAAAHKTSETYLPGTTR